jgi:hypothetical protein
VRERLIHPRHRLVPPQSVPVLARQVSRDVRDPRLSSTARHGTITQVQVNCRSPRPRWQLATSHRPGRRNDIQTLLDLRQDNVNEVRALRVQTPLRLSGSSIGESIGERGDDLPPALGRAGELSVAAQAIRIVGRAGLEPATQGL